MTDRTLIRNLIKLNSDVIAVFHHLDLFQELNSIINKNEVLMKMDFTLLGWMRIAFTNDLVIGIGRICDRSKRTRSLVSFLENLKNSSNLLTRKRYLQLHKSNLEKEYANISFDKLAGKNKNRYSLTRIEGDIRKLTKQGACYKIIRYRHKFIAHNDKYKTRHIPKYKELLEAFEIIEAMVKKYNLLLRATTVVTLRPTSQGDWQKALTVPWIR